MTLTHVAPADWALAEHRIREASALLGRAGQAEGAGDVAALGDLLAVAAAHSPALVRNRARAAPDAFEQAARAPGARSLEGRARASWRVCTRALEYAPRAGRGGGAAVVLTLLIALVEAVEAAAWHRAQEFRAQAQAAADAAVLLREAAGLTGTPPPTTKSRPGRVTRTAGRGLATAGPVTGVPPRPRSGPEFGSPARIGPEAAGALCDDGMPAERGGHRVRDRPLRGPALLLAAQLGDDRASRFRPVGFRIRRRGFRYAGAGKYRGGTVPDESLSTCTGWSSPPRSN
ncbi:hypothetical protein OG592_02490 [Streptomyces avidinii]|uniref:hypothetical protein n=1 Tax=Streptomyces avidinii TaxID=1895 RepID=UPI003869ACB9|nr:hypothetical protein OG592_02490 [Streptomyces avidinii]